MLNYTRWCNGARTRLPLEVPGLESYLLAIWWISTSDWSPYYLSPAHRTPLITVWFLDVLKQNVTIFAWILYQIFVMLTFFVFAKPEGEIWSESLECSWRLTPCLFGGWVIPRNCQPEKRPNLSFWQVHFTITFPEYSHCSPPYSSSW